MALRRSKIVPYFIASLFLINIIAGCSKASKPDPSASTVPQVVSTEKLTIISVSSMQGPHQALDTITGTGFNSQPSSDSVFFNGVYTEVLSATSTQLVVKIPNSATTGIISIKVNGVQINGPTYTVIAMPIITSISPTHGISGGMDTLLGTGFNSQAIANNILFNGYVAEVVSASSSQLIVRIPSSTSGPVSVYFKGVTSIGPLFTYDSLGADDSVMVTTLAGSGIAGLQDGTGTAASFSIPWGITADNYGNVFVADGDNNLIRKITSAGVVTTIAGQGSRLEVYGGGPFFYKPEGIVVDNMGNLYVANTVANTIVKITGGTVSTWAGRGGTDMIDGASDTAMFYHPSSLTVDKQGNVYVSDFANNAIRKITPDGFVSTIAGQGSGHPGSADGLGIAAQFMQPWGITIDNVGNLYVGDWGTEIRKISPDGNVTTLAGHVNGGDNDGTGAAAGFGVRGVAADSSGNLYIADFSNQKIRKVTPSGVVSTIAGTGAVGSKDGSGKTATFNQPISIAVGGDGAIYVGDATNFKIRKIVIKHK
jgi:sugar lactone lactonase YvrE